MAENLTSLFRHKVNPSVAYSDSSLYTREPGVTRELYSFLLFTTKATYYRMAPLIG